MSALIERMLVRFTDVVAREFAGLLHVRGGWNVDELQVEPGDWLAGRALSELGLRSEGVLVLGIDRAHGEFVGAPHGHDVLEPGDTLVLYGQRRRIAEIDDRERGRAGDRAHEQAVAEASGA